MKKKILLFIVAFLTLASPALALEVGGAGGGTPGSSQEVTTKGKCQYGAGNYGPVGIRITIVDSNGNRVAGTNSLDFIQKNNYISVSGSDFQIVNFKPASKYYRSSAYGKTRNENVKDGVTPVLVESTESAYYWSKFPLNSGNIGGPLKTYFVSKFAKTDYNDMLRVFSELRYDISDVEKLKNNYLVIEPIYYFKWDSPIGGCNYETRQYYGTATEVLAMLKSVEGEKVFTFRTASGKVYNHAVYNDLGLGAYVPGVDKAGLIHADAFVGNDYAIEDAIMQKVGNGSYGFGAIVVWLSDLFIETPPETCTISGFKFEPATDCSQNTAGYAGDTDDWNCIYDQLGKAPSTYDGEFYNSGNYQGFNGQAGSNPYCTVACREEVFYNFSEAFSVTAGSRFYIQTSNNFMENVSKLGPITMTGVIECRTGKNTATKANTINIAQFEKDYKTADANVQTAYDNWQNAEAAYEARNHLKVKSWPDSYTNLKGYIVMLWMEGEGGYRPMDTTPRDYNAVSGSCSQHQEIYKERLLGCYLDPKYETIPYTRCRYEGTYRSPTGYQGSITFDATVALGSGCSETGNFHGNNRSDAINAAYNAIYDYKDGAKVKFTRAYNSRENVLNNLKACNNFQRTYSEFSPVVSFVYSDAKYKNNYTLQRKALYESASTTFYNGTNKTASVSWGNPANENKFHWTTGVYGDSNVIHRYDCAGGYQRCTNGSETYPTNTNVIAQTVKSYDYGLPEGIYRYVAKNGVSYNTATEAANSDYPFKDLGQSTLPIAYGTPTGNYNYYLEYYYNGSDGSLFGTSQKFYKYSVIKSDASTVYNGLTISTNLSYKCTYEVKEGLVPPPRDINAIYRSISLSDPFPGESGNGRLSGSNWIGNVVLFGDRLSYIDAYIKNNRNVSGSEVYQLRPMFQFVLSANNITAIRRYNKEQEYNYNDFTLECEEGGRYCKSSFLKEGIGEGYFNFTQANSDGGTCFNATKDSWESCRY